MNLGLQGRKAIICASSRGLGRACATALAREGVDVTINGLDRERLEAVASEITGAEGVAVTPVAGDVGDPAVRERILAACPEPDILINNNAGPPLRDFRQLTLADMQAGVNANMITPIALIQAVIDGMRQRKFGRIINITSSSVFAPLAGLDLSSGARAGLTGFLAGVARQVAADNVTINCVLPGAFDTDRLAAAARAQAQMRNMDLTALREERRQAIPAQRYGDPAEFGALCAYLASAQAGYITGQNFLIDGGAVAKAF